MNDIIGEQIIQQALGATDAGGGFNAQFGIDAAAELLKRGVSTYQTQEKQKQDAASAQAAIQRSLQADVNWANAEVMLETANLSKDPQKIAAAQALQMSSQAAATQAGGALSSDGMTKRISNANDMATKASQASFADSSNAGKAAAMRAWQKIAAAASAQTAQLPGGQQALALAKPQGGGSFMDAMRKRFLGVPVGGWVVGVPVAVVVGRWIFRSMRGSRGRRR